MKKVKELVRGKYNQIALQSDKKGSCCCGGDIDDMDYTIFSDDYSQLEGYVPDADLSLGCGIPTELAEIKPGNTVLDLGSGAGNDCFVARTIVGETGKVVGLDFAGAMITKARKNADKLGFKNVEFIKGDIEEMPFPDRFTDVVISNCVLNLVPDKRKAFSEILRVLNPDGHFCVSDVVVTGDLPDNLKEAGEMYAGCVAGAIGLQEYLKIIEETGFTEIEVRKKKQIMLPEELLRNYLDEKGYHEFVDGETGIYSVTVFARKPGS